MSLTPSVFSLRELCDACLVGVAPQAQAKGWELLVLVYDDVPDLLLGEPEVLGEALSRRLSQVLDQAPRGELVLRGQLELLLTGRCRFRLRLSPTPLGAEGDLILELPFAEPPAGPPRADLEGIAVALLDPHPVAALALGHRLRRAGAQVERFETREALADTLGQPGPQPDALLLGIPAGAGPREAREWLTACRGTSELPVLVVLSGAQRELAESMRQAGAQGCLVRPFATQALVEKLRGLRRSPTAPDSPQDRARALEIVGGDEALAAELLQTLAGTLQEDLAELETLVGAEDWQGVRNLAHRLRGAASYCALTDLWAAAGTLEDAARDGLPGIPARFQALKRQAERVLEHCAGGR